jgi:hypothetical protein
MIISNDSIAENDNSLIDENSSIVPAERRRNNVRRGRGRGLHNDSRLDNSSLDNSMNDSVLDDNSELVPIERDKNYEDRQKKKEERKVLRDAKNEKKRIDEELFNKQKLLALEKLSLEESKIKMEKDILEFNVKCMENAANYDECCICLENPRDTLLTPCGHKFFCLNCVKNYTKNDSSKGCPICRVMITGFNKVFE